MNDQKLIQECNLLDLINKSAFEGFIENNNRAYFYLNYPELCENTKI